MKNDVEIYFNKAGNTIVGGNFADYQKLDKAMTRKNVFLPHGFAVKCSNGELFRLAEYVELFGNCIKTLAGFKKACELSGIELEACNG